MKKEKNKRTVKNNSMKTKNSKNVKTKKKTAFTLIELLAVIIILGILMIIAIPSVTKYISDSRKSAYIDTANEVISGARNLVNEGKLGLYDTSTTYYLDIGCIKTENGTVSPYGEFTKAYVLINYFNNNYSYFWVSVDDAGQGIKKITKLSDLNEDSIESDLTVDDIPKDIGIDNGKYYSIISPENNCRPSDPLPVTKKYNSHTGKERSGSIPLSVLWDVPVPVIGDTAHFVADLSQYEGYKISIKWFYSEDGINWIQIEGETSGTMDVVVNRVNNLWHWRITVDILDYGY